jgi:uncharacterized membrane protein
MVREASRRGTAAVALLIILAIAAGLRLYHLGDQCFWVDELLTMEVINGRGHQNLYLPRNVLMDHPPSLTDPRFAAPWWHIWNGLEDEGHPPLYFILARWWRDLFGSSEAAIRSLSLVFSLAAILLLYFVVRDLNGSSAALWSALLMAFSAPQIVYAQEARNYALLLATSLLAAFFLVRIQLRGLTAARWLGLVGGVLAMALTHYFSFGVLVAMGIYALLVLRNRRLAGVLGTFAAATVVFMLAWGRNLMKQWQVMLHTFPMYADPRGHTQATLLRIVALPLRHLIGASVGEETSIVAGAGLLIAGILTLVYRRRDLLLWWLWLGGAIGTVGTLDFLHTAEQLTMVKYTFAAAPAACAIAAACVPSKFRRLRHLVPMALLGVEIYFLPGAYAEWKGDWYKAAQAAITQTPPGDPVLIAGNGTGRPTLSWLYLGMNQYVNPWPRPLAISDREPSPKLLEELRKYPRLTLVTDCVNVQAGDIVPGFVPVGQPSVFPNVGIVWPLIRK